MWVRVLLISAIVISSRHHEEGCSRTRKQQDLLPRRVSVAMCKFTISARRNKCNTHLLQLEEWPKKINALETCQGKSVSETGIIVFEVCSNIQIGCFNISVFLWLCRNGIFFNCGLNTKPCRESSGITQLVLLLGLEKSKDTGPLAIVLFQLGRKSRSRDRGVTISKLMVPLSNLEQYFLFFFSRVRKIMDFDSGPNYRVCPRTTSQVFNYTIFNYIFR